ncbi:regulator of DNA class I crossover intermediates 1 [Narcine bancroftii]|uniref:regulator of DNA class I crossover intermediates 1 n=1 Tax=Narcine bancroftii TaxID=1343680 RepID=UPI0038317296
MNWVGGVRNRIKLKQQKRQQKEYFEKRKLKTKYKLLAPPVSPQQNSSVSWDLLTLHIVNRIAARKESVDTLNNIIQVDMKKDTKVPMRRHNIELSMSPCSTPSRIILEESQCSMKEKEWNSKQHFTLATNLRYGETSPVIHSNSVEYVSNNLNSSTDKFSGFPLTNSWSSAKNCPLEENLHTKFLTVWGPSNDNQELFQEHFVQDGMTRRTKVNEHAGLNDHENLVTSRTSLPETSDARMLQSSLIENAIHHLNNDEEYVSFSMQEAVSLPQNIATQLATTSKKMTSYGRDFLPAQCHSIERIQPMHRFICQEKYMQSPLIPIKSDSDINVPCNRKDISPTSDENNQIVAKDTINECIFTKPKSSSFQEAIEKDFSGNNLLAKHFQENSSEEFSIQKNIVESEETSRHLHHRRKVFNDSLESSQSPSYSPKETESCCSAFSDLSELDGQNVQLYASVINKDCVQKKLLGDKPVGENFKVQSVPFNESSRENSTRKSSIVDDEQKENQCVSSSMHYLSETCDFQQDIVQTKPFQGQDAWTQTESSVTDVGWSDVAIQCNFANAAEGSFLSKSVWN